MDRGRQGQDIAGTCNGRTGQAIQSQCKSRNGTERTWQRMTWERACNAMTGQDDARTGEERHRRGNDMQCNGMECREGHERTGTERRPNHMTCMYSNGNGRRGNDRTCNDRTLQSHETTRQGNGMEAQERHARNKCTHIIGHDRTVKGGAGQGRVGHGRAIARPGHDRQHGQGHVRNRQGEDRQGHNRNNTLQDIEGGAGKGRQGHAMI